jgi:hypothetical protein
MALTSSQYTALKADIAANTNTVSFGGADIQIRNLPNTGDANVEVAAWYNGAASPNYTVWKKLVSITEIGDKIDGGELAGLSSLNNTRLQTVVMLSQAGVNPSLEDRRQFFDDIFSGAGGVTTRANLLALWKRLATRAQKLFSTGTGSDASPATTATNVDDAFTLTGSDVETARLS